MQENYKNEANLTNLDNSNAFSNEIKDKIEDKKHDLNDGLDKNSEVSGYFNDNSSKFDEESNKKGETHQNPTENVQNSAIFDDEYYRNLYNLKSVCDPVSKFRDKTSHENLIENSIFTVTDEEKSAFSQLFPGVSIEKAQNDPNFKLFAKNKGVNSSFSSIYKDYVDLVKKIGNDIKSRQNIAKNNKNASPGALSSSNSGFSSYFTREQVLKMSKEQIAKNYKVIRESQQKW